MKEKIRDQVYVVFEIHMEGCIPYNGLFLKVNLILKQIFENFTPQYERTKYIFQTK